MAVPHAAPPRMDDGPALSKESAFNIKASKQGDRGLWPHLGRSDDHGRSQNQSESPRENYRGIPVVYLLRSASDHD